MDNIKKTYYENIFVVLTYRNTDDLEDFLKSVERFVKSYKVIIINSYYDDSSKFKFADIAKQYNCDFINVPNKGYSVGNNYGIKYAQKPSAYDLIHLFRQWRQSPQVSKSLSSGHNGIVVRYLLVIDIACLGNPLIGSHIQHLIRKPCHRPVILKAAYVLLNLLGHCRGQNPGIGSGVGDHLFLIQLLHHLKRLIRTDFKHLGTVVLKLRQVVKKGRILGLLFLLLGEHRGRERRLCRQ